MVIIEPQGLERISEGHAAVGQLLMSHSPASFD